MITIVDCGINNLRSVEKAFEHLGHATQVTRDPSVVARAEQIVLPGVGAFGATVSTLRASGLEPVALEAAHSGRPFLGICVGMQLLFDESEEMGRHKGLGILPGRVLRFDERNLGEAARGVKVPQIGWNALHFGNRPRAPLFDGLDEGAAVYFVHSYFCHPDDPTVIAAETDFIAPYCSAVARGSVFGVQFHPEKSGDVGLRILNNFARLAAAIPVQKQELVRAA